MTARAVDDDSKEPTPEEYSRRIDKRVRELKRRILRGRPGKRLDPDVVLDHMQAAIEGRTVLPGDTAYAITIGMQAVLPFPMAQWSKLQWLPLHAIGLRVTSAVALVKYLGHPGNYVGPVLLHSAEEIETHCGSDALADLRYCVECLLLRIPTEAEIEANRDWFIELPSGLYDDVRKVRIPRAYLVATPLESLSNIRHVIDNDTAMIQIDTMGRLLELTLEGLTTILLRGWDNVDMDRLTAAHRAASIQEWLTEVGLRLAD